MTIHKHKFLLIIFFAICGLLFLFVTAPSAAAQNGDEVVNTISAESVSDPQIEEASSDANPENAAPGDIQEQEGKGLSEYSLFLIMLGVVSLVGAGVLWRRDS